MIQYEFLVAQMDEEKRRVTLHFADMPTRTEELPVHEYDWLAAQGLDGWELVSVVDNGTKFYLKRAINGNYGY